MDALRAGYAWRRNQQIEDLAWLAANIINISGKSVKNEVKPKDLTGPKPKDDPTVYDMIDVKKILETF